MVVIRIARGGAGASPNAILDNQNNDFNAFFQDIDGIAVPANPAAGHRRLFVDSADDILKVRTAAGVTNSLEAGAAGGEANTSSNSGAGDGWALAKVGVDLPFKSLITTAPLSTTVNANDLTLVIAALVNADIAAGAAIATTKLADSANFILGDQNNDFNAFFQDIDGIAVPANPAAGHRRLFVDSADDILKVRTAGGSTVSLEGAGGGGGDLTVRIPLIMEPPQGVIGYPDVRSLVTSGSKVTGMVLPDGASVSNINFKCNVPDNLASTPAASIKFIIIGLGVGTTDNVRLTVSSRATADTESVDVALTAETETTVPIPDAAEVTEYYDQDMTTDPTAGDILTVQLSRDPVDGSDDYAADILVIGAYLEIDVTPA